MDIMFDETERIGCVFPIFTRQVSCLFDNTNPVFVKFTKLNLAGCSKIVFYVSGEKILVGEAEIKSIKKLDPEKVWSKYGSRLCLKKNEYLEYSKITPIGKSTRKMKHITVFEMKKPQKYPKAVNSIFPVTPSGRYLTKSMYNKIKKLTK